MEEVTDEPLYRDRVCGIDIGKAGMAVTIRVPSDRNPARRASETRMFPTTRRGVLELADWLRCWQVPAVVMEATSDYWKPVFFRLEAEGFDLADVVGDLWHEAGPDRAALEAGGQPPRIGRVPLGPPGQEPDLLGVGQHALKALCLQPVNGPFQ